MGSVDESPGSWLTSLGAAGFLPAVLFISAANSVIISNFSDLSYSPRVVLVSLILFVLTTAISTPVFRRVSASRTARTIARFLLGAGFCVLAYGAADAVMRGEAMTLPVVALIDGALILGVTISVTRTRINSLCSLSGVISVAIIVYTVISHGNALHTVSKKQDVEPRPVVPDSSRPLPTGNIYHVLLDGFQREIYDYLAREEEERQLDGFEFYPRFTSSYGSTRFSLPNMLTGRALAEGESLLKWQVEATSGGMWADLAKGGMAMTFYPYFDDECPSFGESCHPAMAIGMPEKPNSAIGRPISNEERQLVDFWFLLLLPRSLHLLLAPAAEEKIGLSLDAQLAETETFSITTLVLAEPGVANRADDVPNPVPTATRPEASVYNFRKMLAQEDLRPSQGQYVYVHAHLPHAPYNLDENCVASTEEQVIVRDLVRQSACGIHLVQELISKLKQLDRLDDALILVHSDHGGYVLSVAAFADENPEFFRPETRYVDPDSLQGTGSAGRHPPKSVSTMSVSGRSGALLLMKEPGSGVFRRSDKDVQMIDLAPTILDFIGFDIEGYAGVPIGKLTREQQRDREYFEFEGTSFVPMGRRVFFNANGEMPSILQKAMSGGRKLRMHKFVQDAAGWHYRTALPIEY